MFKVVAHVGSNIGVVDTDDKVVEFVNTSTIIEYLSEGVVIQGASMSCGKLLISPVAYLVDTKELNYNSGRNIFETARELRKENATTYSFISGKKRYRVRIIESVEMNNVKVRLSNGLYTIIPCSFFNKR